MNIAKKRAASALLAAFLLWAPQASSEGEIIVGDVPIAIPAPDGFGPLTSAMVPLYEFQRQLVAPSNEQFVAFIPLESIDGALAGGVPDISKSFSVQTSRSLVDVPASRSDFSDAKTTLKNENTRVMSLIEERIPSVLENLNDDSFSATNLERAFSVAEFVPLPVHTETDRTIAFSARVRYDVAFGGLDLPASTAIGIITTTLVHLKGKVLFLYAYADETSLDWSRDASRRWADDILAANPPGPLERVRGLFGERSLTRDLFAAVIIVLAVALIARARSSRRKRSMTASESTEMPGNGDWK